MSAVSLGPHRYEWIHLSAVAIMGCALYAPYVPRFFWGDDWLWLEQARVTQFHWQHFWNSCTFGYWRPLFVLYLTGGLELFGLKAGVFGAMNVGLHVTNCVLLWHLLRALEVDRTVSTGSSLFLGAYVTGNPVVLSISAWPDLMVVTCALLFARLLLSYTLVFSWRRWACIVLILLLAVASKETGFALVMLFFVFHWIRGRHPFAEPFRIGSILFLAVCAILFALSFGHIAATEKLAGVATAPLRLWYLVVQLVFPLPKRLGGDLGTGVSGFLASLRVALTLALPIFMGLLYRKNSAPRRLFLLWPVLFLAPVSILPLNEGLFALYPGTAVTRYLYAATPGYAFWFALLASRMGKRRLLLVWMGVTLLFAAGWVTARTSRRYRLWQDQSRQVFEQFEAARDDWGGCRCARIENAPLDASRWHPAVLSAMSRLALGRPVRFTNGECQECLLRVSPAGSKGLEVSAVFTLTERTDSMEVGPRGP